MKKLLTRWLSQAVNAVRLRGDIKHKRNIVNSRIVIARLSTFDNDGSALAYLRKINPYIFEELTLSILEQRGIFVLRSASYSGDGGLDGRFYWSGRGWHAIQCKRYGKSITPSHARAFATLCLKSFSGGLFVHTGRTGDASQEALTDPALCILSGSDLARCARDPLADPLALVLARKARQAKYVASQPKVLPVKKRSSPGSPSN